jgi:hypothetical protein
VITNPASVFTFVVFDATDNWDALLTLLRPNLDRRGLRRLRSVLDADCKCVVIEKHYIDKDYRDTFSHFHSKRFSTPSSRCIRLHFFSSAVTEDIITSGSEALQSAYLGYSVIRPTKPNCIGRTLLTNKLRLDPKAHLRVCQEEVFLMGTRLVVEGFPFISQDSDATVCAESALWMLLRYYSNRYQWYSEILPFQITSLASHHAGGHRVYPSSGLYSWQLAEALRLQRLSPVIYSRNQFPKNFDHLLYTYIESGLPLLVTVPQHVVAAFGHLSDYSVPCPTTANSSCAKTKIDFNYTSHFNRAYVINDDNHFPYQMLFQSGQKPPLDSIFDWQQIEEFIVPLPEKVFLTAEQVQTAIEAVLRSNNSKVSISALSPSLAAKVAKKPLLLRLFLTSARSFKQKLRKRGMGHPDVEKIYRDLPMPHFIWVCEIADYDEYASARKILGEVIWDATRNAHEPDGWISLHFPEKLVYDVGSAFNGPQELKTIDLSGQNSYSLFQSNLHTL